MPEIQAFRGFRYNLGQVGELRDVIAPPYDVISTSQQRELYRRHPCNIVRLILNREEAGDNDSENCYTRAERHFRQWKDEDVLVEEGEPALYVYHQLFETEGHHYTRKGFMARVRLAPFDQGLIFPHEHTMPGPKADRLRLMEATGANLSPIFALYPDKQMQVQSCMESRIAGEIPLQATDPDGVTHQLWTVRDSETISEVMGLMGPKPVFIADGHHRYETALAMRENAQRADKTPREGIHYVLMMLVSMTDPGLVVLPTHRLIRKVPVLKAEQVRELMGEDFEWEPMGKGKVGCHAAWDWLDSFEDQKMIGIGTVSDRTWQVGRLKRPEAMQAVAPKKSEIWKGLGVSILHQLVLQRLYQIDPTTTSDQIQYVHELHQVESAFEIDHGSDIQLACLVQPATVTELEKVASGMEKMPPKSTYFYPKIPSGLVINPVC